MRQRFAWRWPFRQQQDNLYPIVSGRELYEDVKSVTGLAKYPIVTLSNYICANSTSTPPDADPSAQEITERLLVDGSLIRFDKQWVSHLTCVAHDEIEQLIPGDGPFNQYTRVCFTYNPEQPESEDEAAEEMVEAKFEPVEKDERDRPGTWTRRVYGDGEDTVTFAEYGIDPARLEVYPNGLGLLFDNQWGYQRLEEIGRTLKGQTTGAAMKALVYGYVRNPGMAKDELNNDEFVAVVPGDLRVDRLGNTTVLDALRAEFELKLPIYLANMNIANMQYNPDRPVGEFLIKLMEPMMRFVDETRRKVANVLEGFGTSVEFEKLYVSSVQDRTAEFLLLQSAFASGVITQQEFAVKAARLI